MKPRGKINAILGILCFCLITINHAESSADINNLEYQVKASYIYNFLQFINFPAESIREKGTVSVCIVGENRFGNTLNVLRGANVPQGQIKINMMGKYSDNLSFEGCNVLYIVENEAAHTDHILEQVHSTEVLTISEYSRFLNQGGCIELFMKDDSIRFKINTEKVKSARYQIAAQLMELGVAQ